MSRRESTVGGIKGRGTSSEQFRLECEARHVYALRVKSAADAHDYLALVRRARGDAAADQLKEAAAKLWEARTRCRTQTAGAA